MPFNSIHFYYCIYLFRFVRKQSCIRGGVFSAMRNLFLHKASSHVFLYITGTFCMFLLRFNYSRIRKISTRSNSKQTASHPPSRCSDASFAVTMKTRGRNYRDMARVTLIISPSISRRDDNSSGRYLLVRDGLNRMSGPLIAGFLVSGPHPALML